MNVSYDQSTIKRNNDYLFPNITPGYYLGSSSIISKYLGDRSDGDGLVMKLNNRGKGYHINFYLYP